MIRHINYYKAAAVALACVVLAAALPGCAGTGINSNEKLDSSNVTDREKYLSDVAESETIPLNKKYKDDAALLYNASGPKVRLYVNADNIVEASQCINEKGEDIIAGEKLKNKTLQEAIDYMTERSLIRGYLSDNNTMVRLTVETVDASVPDSVSTANALIQASQKVIQDRMGLHGIKADVEVVSDDSSTK